MNLLKFSRQRGMSRRMCKCGHVEKYHNKDGCWAKDCILGYCLCEKFEEDSKWENRHKK